MQISFPAIAVVVSLLALTIAVLNYWRKSSVSIRGQFTLASSIDSEDRYVAYVLLENMKDRAVAIYSIYLSAGHNHYVLIEDFEDAPQILRPYETLKKDYGPIEFYEFNSRRLNMEPVLGNRKFPHRLVLATSSGRYVIRRYIGHWNPVLEHFRNRALTIARPVRSTYKSRAVGGNVRYILDFEFESGNTDVMFLHGNHFDRHRLRGFELNAEALETADTLLSFLNARISEGALKCKAVRVIDAKEWRSRSNDPLHTSSKVDAQPLGLFAYYVVARFYCWLQDLKMKRNNKQIARERKKA